MENYNIAHCNYANDAQLCIIVSPRDCSSVYLLIVFGDYQAKPKIKDKSAFTLHYKISTICELFQVAIRESGWCITDAQISNRWNNLTCCDFKSRNMKCVKVKKKNRNSKANMNWNGWNNLLMVICGIFTVPYKYYLPNKIKESLHRDKSCLLSLCSIFQLFVFIVLHSTFWKLSNTTCAFSLYVGLEKQIASDRLYRLYFTLEIYTAGILTTWFRAITKTGTVIIGLLLLRCAFALCRMSG